MRWLRRIVWRITKRAWDDHEEFEKEQQQKLERASMMTSGNPVRLGRGRGNLSRMFDDNGDQPARLRASSMNFRLYACVGGHILETSIYNEKEDETDHTLYMINDDEDFAKQVSQSIMLEMMKQ